MKVHFSSNEKVYLVLSLAFALLGCGGEAAANSAAQGTPGQAPAQEAAPALAPVAARARFVGTWHMSGSRSLPHLPAGLRAMVTANPNAANDTMVVTASSLTTHKEGQPGRTQTYTVDTETPNGLSITTTTASGTIQHNEVTFESNDVVLVVSGEMHIGMVFVRAGSPTEAADRAAHPAT